MTTPITAALISRAHRQQIDAMGGIIIALSVRSNGDLELVVATRPARRVVVYVVRAGEWSRV